MRSMHNDFNLEPRLPTKNGIISKYAFPEITKTFIDSNFKVRTCNKYKLHKNGLCNCNKEFIDHKDSANENEVWSYKNNTSLGPCSTYGIINFQGYDYIPHGHYPKFIRFDCLENCKATCESVYKLFTEYEPWKIPAPKLIISINGGLKKMKFTSNQHKKNFKQGLMDVMKKDQTWVIGSGFNVGIHKLVSETIYEFRLHHEDIKDQVTLIGISTWGVVRNNQKLLQVNEFKKLDDQRANYKNILSNEKGKVTLDALYDHFLFCDDGTEKIYDKEIDFRLQFENYAKSKADGFLVQILFEGGKRAITNAYNALAEKVPLVVIKGSGRVADIISEVMELPSKNCKENIINLMNENQSEFQLLKEEVNEYSDLMFQIYNNFRKQVVIYNMMDTGIKFDKKILEAMILGADKSLEKTLQLCIRFNCPDIAEKLVFSDSKYGIINIDHIRNMFMSALEDNKPEFINLFLENNFDVEQFISENVLKKLYTVSFDPEKCHCAELLSDLTDNTSQSCFAKRKSADLEQDILINIGNIIQKLSGNILDNRYEELFKWKKRCNEAYNDMEPESNEFEPNSEDDYPVTPLNTQDLFLWALLSGRTNLSQIFWKVGKDHIGSALIASSILKNMAALVLIRGDNNLQQKLTDASAKFQDKSISIVNEAFNKSKSKTYTLFVRSLKRWNNLTCLKIANNGDMLEFLNHSACRLYSMKVWMGDLSPFLSSWKIILTIPLSLFLMKPMIMPSFPPMKVAKDDVAKVNFQNKLLNQENKKLQNTNDLKRDRVKQISFCKSMSVFYGAPVVKFWVHLISYIVFLMIFSYVNLVELQSIENVKSVREVLLEIYVYIYVLTFTIEEIRQLLDQEITGVSYKIKAYFAGFWNKLDAFIIILFITGTVMRFTIPNDLFMLCRCMFSITLSLFFLRSMQFYFVSISIGPKVIMIGNMLRDILFFLSIFIIFLIAYGTLAQSLKFPNSSFDITLIKDIVYLPYFQSYGELSLEFFANNGPCNSTYCIAQSVTIVFSFAIFLLMSNVLLINLLIAMFGYTFNQIQEESEKLWCFIRLQLVQEFYDKPLFPPPFNIIYYVFKIISLPCHKLCPKVMFEYENNLLLQQLDIDQNFKFSAFEQFCMEASMNEVDNQKVVNTEKPSAEMVTITELLDKYNIKPELSVPVSQTDSILSFQKRVSMRLDNIERQLENKN